MIFEWMVKFVVLVMIVLVFVEFGVGLVGCVVL